MTAATATGDARTSTAQATSLRTTRPLRASAEALRDAFFRNPSRTRPLDARRCGCRASDPAIAGGGVRDPNRRPRAGRRQRRPNDCRNAGRRVVQQILNWLAQLALWGSLASILAGAAIYGVATHSGNLAGGYRGKQLAFAGAVGACLAGLAPTIINMLFEAARSA